MAQKINTTTLLLLGGAGVLAYLYYSQKSAESELVVQADIADAEEAAGDVAQANTRRRKALDRFNTNVGVRLASATAPGALRSGAYGAQLVRTDPDVTAYYFDPVNKTTYVYSDQWGTYLTVDEYLALRDDPSLPTV